MGFIDHVVSLAQDAGWTEDHIHVERFSGGDVDTTSGFEVVARRSGITFDVAEGQAALDAGLGVPFACETGICGSCVCAVLDGVPDHKDSFQTEAEKSANTRMALCRSRAQSGRVVLDL